MRAKHAVHFTTGKDDWQTPPDFYAKLHAEFNFDLDPCTTPGNPLKCLTFLTAQEDGLKSDWMGARAFVNPPYSQLRAWVAKSAEEARKGSFVVMLIPARTDTRAFHEHIYDQELAAWRPGVSVRFLKGRLKFVGGASSAPFPSMVVIFQPS